MKVKMIKMGSANTNDINCRLRGIVISSDNKPLFLEIGSAYSPNINNTSLSQKEYNLKFPNPEYVSVDFCYRVDIPEDFYKNRSKEFDKFVMNNLYEIPYTKKGVLSFLKLLNKEIDDIELVDDYYIDKYCEEQGFYELYDDRLLHKEKLEEIIWVEPKDNGEIRYKYRYICFAKNGTVYSELKENISRLNDVINKYGKEEVKKQVEKFIETKSNPFNSIEVDQRYKEFFNKKFEANVINLENQFEDYGYM